jgi:hypothetical protein
MSLCVLAEKYGVDKCPAIFHSYTPEYHILLGGIREHVHTVLEIGIGNETLMRPIVGDRYCHGASLRMWRDYFPHAQITGCDILPSTLFTDERINTVLIDQSNAISLETLEGPFDLIIDDGSHIVSHMLLSLKTLWSKLKPGGLYIIEDIKKADMHIFTSLDKFEIVKVHEGLTDWDGFIVFRNTNGEPYTE